MHLCCCLGAHQNPFLCLMSLQSSPLGICGRADDIFEAQGRKETFFYYFNATLQCGPNRPILKQIKNNKTYNLGKYNLRQ